jgi:Na+/citrate or Na+/malate symporter
VFTTKKRQIGSGELLAMALLFLTGVLNKFVPLPVLVVVLLTIAGLYFIWKKL